MQCGVFVLGVGFLSFVSHYQVRPPSESDSGNAQLLQMTSWNSIQMKITYEVFGWIGCSCWVIFFYPQVILNFRRKRYFLSTKTQKRVKLFQSNSFASHES